jgi:two-component system response regulator HydG
VSENRILIVDDDPGQADSLRRVLVLEGFRAECLFSPEDAMRAIGDRKPDAIVSDFRMGAVNGLEFYQQVKEVYPDMLFILTTGYGTVETAVEALRHGVHDFLTKPIDTDELIIKLKKALNYRSLESENTRLKEKIADLVIKPKIIGESALMKQVLDQVEQVADSMATVLIEGESGTGKELIAKSLHADSPRAGAPYIKVNCAAIPENLLESELFGHEAGAFTGAIHKRIGKFELADGGSIFLDEVGEMPLHLQPKFLRVLQEREVERLGGSKTIDVDVRVIAATNRNLEEMVKEGEFRKDLFYRLNVIPIRLPPLRDRIEDVLPIARHFLAQFSERNGRDISAIGLEASNKLKQHSWPGNVRELENCMERAVVLARGQELEPGDFQFSGEPVTAGVESLLEKLMTTDMSLEELERRIILMALERCDGNVSQTARKLGMTRRSLQYRVEKIKSDDKDSVS